MPARADEPDAPSTSVTAGDTAWLRAGDRLLRGIAHDLSGHVAVLSSLVGILGFEDQAPDSAEGLLATEVGRLEEALTLLRTYPADRGEGAGAVSMAQVLPPLLRLHEVGSATEAVAVSLRLDPGLPAARLAPTPFARAVLLLLRQVTEIALVLARPRVDVYVREEGNEIVIGVRPAGDAVSGDPGLLAAAAAYAAEAGGRLCAPGNGMDEPQIRFPALRARLDPGSA